MWCLGSVAPRPVEPSQTWDRTRVPCIGRRTVLHCISSLPSLLPLQAAERDNQNLEDKVRSLKTDIEESKYRQRHLKVELKSFLEVRGGKVCALQDFHQGLSKPGASN